ncbi:MAG: formate dehydrogenase accessory protein FdhE [Desulfurococcales archaeon]|nr:formate dehydrogenase accessory protein FdhE [Desulfurococcales archaeon]
MAEPSGRLEEFREALRKYGHLIKVREFDPELASGIEEKQLQIIEDASRIIEEKKPRTLEELLDALLESGSMQEYVVLISRVLGEKVSDPEEAVKAVIEGNEALPGFRSGFLALQAVARAYAEAVLKEGIAEEPSAKCPLCGVKSETMARKGSDYVMVCHFCYYEWIVSRDSMMCPYCGAMDPIAIGIYTDKKRRLGLAHCQNCGSTWRCILDEGIRAPRQLLPLIAFGAEIYRRFLEEASGPRG